MENKSKQKSKGRASLYIGMIADWVLRQNEFFILQVGRSSTTDSER